MLIFSIKKHTTAVYMIRKVDIVDKSRVKMYVLFASYLSILYNCCMVGILVNFYTLSNTSDTK